MFKLFLAIAITQTIGWFESGAVKWTPTAGQTYTVSVRPEGGSYTALDAELVRNYGSYYRADAVGLAAGNYQFKIEASNGDVVETSFVAHAHDRSGFAHSDMPNGIGAYKNDGTLKAGARVFYVTANTAKTIHMDVKQDSKGSTLSCTGLQTIIDAYQKGYENTPLCIRIVGKVAKTDLDKISSSAEGIQIKGKGVYSDMPITIEGIGNDATVHGFGFLIRNAKGVEFRNFAIMCCLDDCLSFDTGNSNCWVHNMDLFYGSTGGDADQAKGDGTVDVKGKSKLFTVSYNHFYDCGKTSLGGMDGSTGENGCYHTYHHNWFDHSDSRHPRIRSQFFHVYNNYYDGVSKYGVGAAAGGASAFVERNYFRNTKYPMLSSKQGTDAEGDGTFSGEDGGVIKAYDNIIINARKVQYWSAAVQANGKWDAYLAQTRTEQVPTSVVSYSGSYPYNYAAERALLSTYIENKMNYADEIPDLVRGELGAGRMEHGDFDWKFRNSEQDDNYAVIADLKAAVVGYESTLIGLANGTTVSPRTPAANTVVGGDGQGVSEDENDSYIPAWAGGGSSSASGLQKLGTDGDYFWFNADNETAYNAYVQAGTITTTGTFSKNQAIKGSDGTMYSDYTGSVRLAQNQTLTVYNANGISHASFYVSATGSMKWKLETSTNGTSWTNIATIEGTKGSHPTCAINPTDATIKYFRITNLNASNRDVQGVKLYEPLPASDLTNLISTNLQLAAGATLQLQAGTHYTTSSTGAIHYRSTIERIATVSETGLITANVLGKTKIYLSQDATAQHDSKTLIYTLEVTDTRVASDLTLTSSDKLTVQKGQSATITATCSDNITYTSTNSSIATVNAAGLVQAVGFGTTTIIVANAGNATMRAGEKIVTVTVPDTRAASALTLVSSDEISLTYGDTCSIVVTGALGTLTYTTSNDSVVSIDATGLVTAIADGEVDVVISDEGDANTQVGTVYLTITVSGSPAPVVGDSIIWKVGNATITAQQTNTITATDGKTELTYVAGSSCKVEKGQLKMGGATQFSSNVLSNRYFILPALTGSGTLMIEYGDNVGEVVVTANTNKNDASLGSITQTTKSLRLTDLSNTEVYLYANAKVYYKTITWIQDKATDVQTIRDHQVRKALINGKLVIIRGDKRYDISGRAF